ncbi:nucleotidyltransferase domain-containing protein [Streptomyces sp. NPDC101225]|uniref:nucleotidyltransferase domain-containing protein n=1 Tax=Streptomyces sp. NPDC101225 TaxID=3366135 RepID=UPI0038160180
MADQITEHLLDRFAGALQPLVPLVAVWAHGSLAAGDYRPGRSDLDLVALLGRTCTPAEEQQLSAMHEALGRDVLLASRLHCSYLAVSELDDAARSPLTWAHEELTHRPVTPVTRRELHAFGRVLHGRPPAGLLPPVTDRQLADFILEDLQDFWRPALEHPQRWRRDIWVDLGLLTLARATVTLQEGRLITKAEALDVLTELGAPIDVVDDIRQRRYGTPGPADHQWISRRASPTLAFLKPAIDQALSTAP